MINPITSRGRVLMFHPRRLERGPRMWLFEVRKSRVEALLATGWAIYMGRAL